MVEDDVDIRVHTGPMPDRADTRLGLTETGPRNAWRDAQTAPPASAAGADRDTARRRSTDEATYWDIEDIQFHCRMGRTAAWQLVRTAKDFPCPVVLGRKSRVWPRVEVIAFMEGRRRPDHYSQRTTSATVTSEPKPTFATRPVRSRTPSRRGTA
jgi:predicted DNA-binding transcriptional regulator AlpA